MIVKLLKQVLYLTFIALIVIGGYLGLRFYQFQTGPIQMQEESVQFVIQQGNSLRQVAERLADEGYIEDQLMFIALSRVTKPRQTIKTGEYRLTPTDTPLDLLQRFRKGEALLYSLTIIEGWTFQQMLNAIQEDPVLIKTLDYSDIPAIMAQISTADEHHEGRFLPDTYLFPRGTTDLDYLQRAYATMQKKLAQLWAERAEGLLLKTPYEALTLASIIEKETGVAFERPMISAVFHRRLQKNMRLQTDPTIIYGLGDEFDGDIRYRDLRRDTPYNTYLHKGLTPTPIALPGADAIHAALHPDDGEALFFVAKGDGTHYFSKTLEEHNKAVRKYQLKGK